MGVGDLLRRGLAAGAAAGLAAAVVLYLLVEPVIRRALEIEDARGGHDHGEEPLVTRGMQVLGGALTVTLSGVLFGIVFAVVFAQLRHRLAGSSDFVRSLVLAALGFLVFAVLPALKMPANPPAVGDPETVTRRTLLYLLVVLLGLALVLAVAAVDRTLSERGVDVPRGAALSTLAFVVGVTVLFLVVPGTPDSIPPDVPADVIWDFRLAALAQAAATWTTLGLVFGLLVASVSEERQPVAV